MLVTDPKTTAMKNKIAILAILLPLIMTGCGKEIKLSSDKDMLKFSIERSANPSLEKDIHGVIDDEKGTVTLRDLPAGSYIASFNAEGTVTVNGTEQVSGVTSNYFGNAVKYNVTAEDGSSRQYDVISVPPASSDKQILSYSFMKERNENLGENIYGRIDEDARKITLAVPSGTSLMLVASFETTGNLRVGDKEQVSGETANDFSSAIIYKVVAEDGTYVEYEVTVTTKELPGSGKQITSFMFDKGINGLEDDLTATIDQEEKVILIPHPGTKTTLIASFEAEGTVYVGETAQVSGQTQNDFSQPVTYRVVAQDGSSVEYRTVTGQEPGNELLSSFELNITQGDATIILTGKADHTTYTISFEKLSSQGFISDIHEAVAHFATNGTSVKVDGTEQTSGVTRNDFRKNVLYTVTDRNGKDFTYTVIPPKCPQTTGLPVIHIDTYGAGIPDKINYVPCDFDLLDPSDTANDLSLKLTADGGGGIRLRGNTTISFPKKPYRIKFDKKTSLFGLGKAKSWVLLANYRDFTLLTNTVAFEVGKAFSRTSHPGSGAYKGLDFVNTANHVEVFLNGDYQGSYVLTEQVQVNEYRVNIDEEKDYFVELDVHFDEDAKFGARYFGLGVNVKSPEYEPGILPEDNPLRKDFETMAGMLHELHEGTTPTGDYKDFADIYSYIDMMMVNDIVANPEYQYPASNFMYKAQGDKWRFGPLWDFDNSFGFYGTPANYFSDMEILIDPEASVSVMFNNFFKSFFKDPGFREAYKARWNQMKPVIENSIASFIEDTGSYLSLSAAENQVRWAPYYDGIDYASHITKMKNWYRARITQIDNYINSPDY